MELSKKYNPKEVEDRIYELWLKSGFFNPDKLPGRRQRSFTIIMPPPNANAPIHIGFGVNVSIEDLMIRYHRMKGELTLWLPGADHAGILSQVVFERQLAEKGLFRYDLGRKKFFKEIMKFTLGNKKIMQSQIKALGASCDWTRDSFTLDAKFDEPIYTLFKKLYQDKLIYRAERMINWCSRCQTALSDLEIEHREEKTKLWYIKYEVKNQKSKVKKSYITVATTRPETMLGDTAVAVNPKDKRYKNLTGQKVILPLMNREIPIITDESVNLGFGTGVVKVTPAHDPVDFEIGQRHKLKTLQVIGFDGKMTKEVGEYAGLEIREARERVLSNLKKQELLEREESYTHSIGYCERCKTLIEPLISTQWFIKIKPLAQSAIKVVKKGEIKIIPRYFEKIYFNWLKNIKDWCISRQLWWGHQLPIWYCGSQDLSPLQKQMNKIPEVKGCGEVIVSIKTPKKCPKCGNANLIHDPDTLDTWFSSGQWSFNTLGWPKKTGDFQAFYPTSVMETGYEILFFWIARMVMLGLYATGKIPFKTVYLHGMVRDVFGRKMSKSRPETCVDPVDAIEKYGADALRMALIMGNAPGTDLVLSENKIKGMRNLANKIWNATRFVLTTPELKVQRSKSKSIHKDDKWILKKLNKTTKKITNLIERYRFDLAAKEIYQFFWHVFCDKYIELTKERKKDAQPTLLSVLRTTLILLHPFMPFITEEIYQKLPIKNKKRSLMVESWPV